MKIEETCTPASQPVFTLYSDVPLGTVFKFWSDSKCCLGTKRFLKVVGGIVDLDENLHYSQSPGTRYREYTPFPAARVVLK